MFELNYGVITNENTGSSYNDTVCVEITNNLFESGKPFVI